MSYPSCGPMALMMEPMKGANALASETIAWRIIDLINRGLKGVDALGLGVSSEATDCRVLFSQSSVSGIFHSETER